MFEAFRGYNGLPGQVRRRAFSLTGGDSHRHCRGVDQNMASTRKEGRSVHTFGDTNAGMVDLPTVDPPVPSAEAKSTVGPTKNFPSVRF